MVNWKVLCLLPCLTVASVVPSAYANTSHHSTVIAQEQPQDTTTPAETSPSSGSATDGNTTKKHEATTHTSTSTKKSTSGVLKLGSHGEAVKTAQTFLKQQKFYSGPINGKFGPLTQSAVIKFQKSKGIKPDGILGPKTLAAMQ
jgi:peptidoglycan hydrolase-like protein with peptidoglycan-binding domain